MIIVKSIFDLRKQQTDELVFVENNGLVYQSVDGNWIEKRYFSSIEVKNFLQIGYQEALDYMRMFNTNRRTNRDKMRVTFDQLRRIKTMVDGRKISQ